jgi:hypothetical protein
MLFILSKRLEMLNYSIHSVTYRKTGMLNINAVGTQNLASIVKPSWDVFPCSLVDMEHHFEVNCCLLLHLSCRRRPQITAIRWCLSAKLYGVKSWINVCPSIFIYVRNRNCIDLSKTKRRLLYLKTQSVPRCKHFSSRL